MSRHIRFIIDAVTQSWGVYNPGDTRQTLTFPTRAGVAGLLGNALGLDRTETDLLDRLHRGVRVSSRVLREGTFMRDFHNKKFCPTDKQGGDPWDNACATHTKNPLKDAHNRRSAMLTPEKHPSDGGQKTSTRYYLNDWAFQVVVEVLPSCPFSAERLVEALRNPARGLFFGRKSCIPLRPLIDGEDQVFEASSPIEVFSTPSTPIYEIEDKPRYKYADPSEDLVAHLDVDEVPPGTEGCIVREVLRDACHSVNGRIFRDRVVVHVTRVSAQDDAA